MKRNSRSFILAGVAALIGGAVVTSTLWAQGTAETFSATASVKGPQGTMTAPVVVVIERYTTDAERSQAVEALKAGGNQRAATGPREDAGYRTTSKWASERTPSSMPMHGRSDPGAWSR